MVLHEQTFETLEEAQRFQEAFPYCGTCRGTVKIQNQLGYFRLTCILNPHHHDIGSERIGKHV